MGDWEDETFIDPTEDDLKQTKSKINTSLL